jgi:hypothetical protein
MHFVCKKSGKRVPSFCFDLIKDERYQAQVTALDRTIDDETVKLAIMSLKSRIRTEDLKVRGNEA